MIGETMRIVRKNYVRGASGENFRNLPQMLTCAGFAYCCVIDDINIFELSCFWPTGFESMSQIIEMFYVYILLIVYILARGHAPFVIINIK